MFAHDNPPMLRELAAAGADVNARTTAYSIRSPSGGMKLLPGGETALHLAAVAGNAEAVRVLLQAGAEVEAQAEDGRAPLDYAVQLGSVTEAAEALVEAGAQLTPQRLETMHSAAHNPDSDLIMFLTPSGASHGPRGDQAKPAPREAEKPRPGTAQAEPNGITPKEFRCPKCHALIYSRKPRLCGQCGALLPPELLLSDQQAEAFEDERRWARELADKFSTRDSSQDQRALSLDAQSLAGKSLAKTFSPQDLLRRVSCAEEFRHRDRPAFWLYVAGYGFMLFIAAFLFINLGAMPPTALLLMVGFFAFLCFRAWHRASPICPNCNQNIRYCTAAFCHVCGQALGHQRCVRCGVDNSWTHFLRPYVNAGNSRWIIYCPACGVQLDSKVPRWRSAKRI
jgi:hypothetical protein